MGMVSTCCGAPVELTARTDNYYVCRGCGVPVQERLSERYGPQEPITDDCEGSDRA